MPLFFIFAALLVVAALAAIVPKLLKKASGDELDQLETNIQIAKDSREKLQRSLNNGAIDQATYDAQLLEVEQALAEDLGKEHKNRGSARGEFVIAAIVTLFIPIASGALYLHLGTPSGVDSQAMHRQAVQAQTQAAQASAQAPDLNQLLPDLEKKLEANPEDREGWKLLGKSYLLISEFTSAKRALLKAYALDGDDADLLTQLAEATAMEKGGDLSGEPTDYLDRALTLSPRHEGSTWLRAIASQQAGAHEDAIARLQSLRTGVTGNPSAIASIDELINQSKQALGLAADTAAQATAPVDSTDNSSPKDSGAAISVTVSLADGVIENVKPTDSVFIFARASSGPPMPLAVARHTVNDLPITVVLDDTMAMMPAMTLSQFPKITVGARVSPSGNAIAQPGDWYGEKNDVIVADVPELSLVIDTKK